MATLAYSYVRMSTQRQSKGDSLRRQLDWSEGFAQREGLILDSSLRDIGVSAWRGRHREKGALGEFLRMVREGAIPKGSYLLVESLDRLSREEVHKALEEFISILNKGIHIVTMEPEHVYRYGGDFTDLIIALTLMSRANEESERKSSRVRASLKTRREMAQAGHKVSGRPPSWITATRLGKYDFHFELNERAETVRSIFQMSADGMGVDRIARTLNAQKVATFAGGTQGWWSRGISAILTSRTAIGEYQPIELRDGKRVPVGALIAGYFPPAVTADLFMRAQKQPVPRAAGRRGEEFSNLFGDLSRCAHCGTRMYFRNSGLDPRGKWRFYLVCHNGSRAGGCDKGKASVPYQHVENSILDHVREFAHADSLRMQRANDALARVNEALADATRDVELLEQQAGNLLDAVAMSGGNALLLERLVEVQTRLEPARALVLLLAQTRDHETIRSRADDPSDMIQQLRASWETDETGVRYASRSRVQSALRKYVTQIDFDSQSNTFTVVLLEGIRAYQFDNVGRGLPKPRAPRVVDVMPFMPSDPAYGDADALAQRGMTAIESGLVNIRDDAGEFQPTSS